MSDQAIAEVGQIIRTEDNIETRPDRDWQQYVTFLVDGRSYDIEITKIREIRGWSKPTSLPNAPHAMRGLLNLRGIVVPVFDLHC